MPEIADILMAGLHHKASDILLAPRQPPVVRIDGVLRPLPGSTPVPADECRRWIYELLDPTQRAIFERDMEADFAFDLGTSCRFRVNVFVQADGVGAALRYIPQEIPGVDAIALPPAVQALVDLPRGLVLVTGPTGSGKSTTLAAMLESVNLKRKKHILTIEDPVEFLYRNKNSVVNQREVGLHTASFGNALKYALRQNPDIIMIGEMRDAETISLALAAAETGHLCLSTLHTQDAASTVNRIIDEFPHEQQAKIKTQVCAVLSAVISQQLLPKRGGGRVCAREIMVMNPAIGSLIRENKISQLYGAIESGSAHGMVSMDQSLAQLVKSGQVELNEAMGRARDPQSLRNFVGLGSAPQMYQPPA